MFYYYAINNYSLTELHIHTLSFYAALGSGLLHLHVHDFVRLSVCVASDFYFLLLQIFETILRRRFSARKLFRAALISHTESARHVKHLHLIVQRNSNLAFLLLCMSRKRTRSFVNAPNKLAFASTCHPDAAL